MECSTQQVLLQIQLDDIQGLLDNPTRSTAEEEDFALALASYRAEISLCLSIVADRTIAHELASTTVADQNAIRCALDEEIGARDDRTTARRLAGSHAASQTGAQATAVIDEIEGVLNILEKYSLQDSAASLIDPKGNGISVFSEDNYTNEADRDHSQSTPDGQEGPSSSLSSSRAAQRLTHETCIVCDDRLPTFDIIHAPCSHIYCRACILRLFEQATIDRELFPPRCCRQPITLPLVEHMVSREFVRVFEAKEEEFTTAEPLYCHKSTCSAFIRPCNISKEAGKCSVCRCETCVSCRKSKHEGLCEEDGNVKALMTLAGNEGWQTCSRCRNMVELGVGCNHITCRCGNEFCYICARAWKTCVCPQWDETRLLERGQAVARNQMPGGQANRAAVMRAVHRLREDHDCAHYGWLPRSTTTRRCELCARTFPWVVACRCGTNMCVDCKNNRLR